MLSKSGLAAAMCTACLLSACGGQLSAPADCAHLPPGSAQPRQVIVTLDLSASRTTRELSADRQLLEGIIDNLFYCEQLMVLDMQASTRDSIRAFTDTVPPPWDMSTLTSLDQKKLDGKRHALRAIVPLFFDSSRAVKWQTDIIASLHTVSEYMRDAHGRRPVLYLLSDMLQSSGDIEMSRAVPTQAWIGRQQQQGLIPVLTDACVVAIGPEAGTRHGVQVRDFWISYFSTAGARLNADNWRRMATPQALPDCRIAAAAA
jgi:hypothetical protein